MPCDDPPIIGRPLKLAISAMQMYGLSVPSGRDLMQEGELSRIADPLELLYDPTAVVGCIVVRSCSDARED